MTDKRDEIVKRQFNEELARYPDPVSFALGFPVYITEALERATKTEEANILRAIADMGLAYMKQTLPRAVADRDRRHELMAPTEKAYIEASAAAGVMWAATENKEPHGGQGRKGSADPPIPSIHVTDGYFRDARDATRCVRAGTLHPEDRRTYYDERMQDGAHLTLNGIENIWRLLYAPGTKTGPLYVDNEGVAFYFWALPRPLTEGWGSGDVWKRMVAELDATPDVAFGRTDQIPGGVLAVDRKTGYEWAKLPFKDNEFAFGYWDPPYDQLYKTEAVEIWRTCRKLAILHTHVYPRAWLHGAKRKAMAAITMGPMKQMRCLQVFEK